MDESFNTGDIPTEDEENKAMYIAMMALVDEAGDYTEQGTDPEWIETRQWDDFREAAQCLKLAADLSERLTYRLDHPKNWDLGGSDTDEEPDTTKQP